MYVNGDLTLKGFQFGDVAGPLDLPADMYEIEIYGAGSDPGAGDPALAGSSDLSAGADATSPRSQSGMPGDSSSFRQLRPRGRPGQRLRSVLGSDQRPGCDADVPADSYNIKITASGDPATVAFDTDVPWPGASTSSPMRSVQR